MTTRGTEAPRDREKQFSQIIIPASDVELYIRSGWERVEDLSPARVAVRKRVQPATS